MKYIVINGPRGVRVARQNGRIEGQELSRGEVVSWAEMTRENALIQAQALRDTQAQVAMAKGK